MNYLEEQYVINTDYVPNNCSEVIFKTEQECLETNDPPDEEEYRILDISTNQEPYIYPEQTSEIQEEYEAGVEHEDSDDCDDEDRGVLKHVWQDEDPNNGSDNEQDSEDLELKATLSNIVKFINFLNKLQEDHYTFVNSDIENMLMIEKQKRAVVINVYMIADLVKVNFDFNNSQVNEIANELKRILSIKVELFDKLHDKQVNGVVSQDVIKRLFSGNHLLIKSQIDELRGILFKKLENVHKTLAEKQRTRKKLKQASRKMTLQKVCTRPTPVQNNSVEKKIRDTKIKNNNLHTMTQQVSSSLQNIQVKKCKIKGHIDRLIQGDRPRHVKSANMHTMEQDINSSLQNIQEKKSKIKAQIESLLEEYQNESNHHESYNSLKRKSQTINQESTLEDFDSFTQVISKKLKLKPGEASPSLILSKFRNNLNKKLNSVCQVKNEIVDDQEENQVSFIELDLEDYREEEALVEEVFFEDDHSDYIEDRVIKSFSGGWYGDNTDTGFKNTEYRETAAAEETHDSSYIIQDLTNYKPHPEENQVMSYMINDVTLTKLPSTPHQPVLQQPNQPVYEHLILSEQVEKLVQKTRTKPVHFDLASADIEKSLLKDREKAMWQLEHMVDQASKDKTIWNKFLRQLNKTDDVIVTTSNREIVQEHLETRLKELEDKAELARKSLLLLNKNKRKTNKELGDLCTKDSTGKSFINKNFEGKPYVLKKSNDSHSNITVKAASPQKPYVPRKIHKLSKVIVQNNSLLESPEINNKLKALFKNNNLKGTLMKKKFVNHEEEVINNINSNSDGESQNISNGNLETTNDNEVSTDRFITLSNPKTNTTVTVGRPKMSTTMRKLNEDSIKNNSAVNFNVEVALLRKNVHEGKKSLKTIAPRSFVIPSIKKPLALTLPGDSSKLLLRKAPQHVTRMDSRDFLKNRIKTKRKKSTEAEELQTNLELLKNKIKSRRKSSKAEEFESSDSKSKKLLETLKQQIFEKLHRQDNVKRSAEIKQEIEKRLRRKEKLKTWQKLSK
uniref:Uncharacterized protein n=1 Tax=Cacopsylla melanoneura TaxID=428564 RepID=A0A8D8YQ03_9HEMI